MNVAAKKKFKVKTDVLMYNREELFGRWITTFFRHYFLNALHCCPPAYEERKHHSSENAILSKQAHTLSFPHLHLTSVLEVSNRGSMTLWGAAEVPPGGGVKFLVD